MKAVKDGNASFNDGTEMHIWLRSTNINKLNNKSQWPTPETEEIWRRFYKDYFSENTVAFNCGSFFVDFSNCI